MVTSNSFLLLLVSLLILRSLLFGPLLFPFLSPLATFLAPLISNLAFLLPIDAVSFHLTTGKISSPYAKPEASFHLPFPQLLGPVGFLAGQLFIQTNPICSLAFFSSARFQLSGVFPQHPLQGSPLHLVVSGCDPGSKKLRFYFLSSERGTRRALRRRTDIVTLSPLRLPGAPKDFVS